MIDLSSSDLIRLLVDRSATAVAVLDRELRYLAANDRHLVAYGLAGQADVVGLSHLDLIPAAGDSFQEGLKQCLEDGAECCGGEATVFSAGSANGGGRQLCWEMHPWRDGSGILGGVVLFTESYASDETEISQCAWERLRHAEDEASQARRELAAARDEVLEASRVKSSFMATMSHELRTPLASILLFCEMLQEDAVADGNMPLAADLARVVGAGQQLRSLIDDLLDFAKLEAGRSRLDPAPFDVCEMLRKATAAVRPLAESTGNVLEIRCPDAIGVIVADPGKVRQSLMNLLTNACKFTESGRILTEAFRTTDQRGEEWLVLRVHDTGIGISQEVLPRLFRDFVQGDPSLTRKYGGTGLGLAMTRRYVEMMGGEVFAESSPGEGAIFTIRLPAASED